MKADTGQLQEFLKLNDISAMVMSIASRSFSMENRVPFVFILDEMTTFKVRDFEKLPSVLREYGAAFLLLTHSVVVHGVRNGIEKVSNLLMPTLFVLLIVIAVASCLLPGADAGIKFLFHPDFSKINKDTLLDALGQAFFSLSLLSLIHI